MKKFKGKIFIYERKEYLFEVEAENKYIAKNKVNFDIKNYISLDNPDDITEESCEILFDK